MVKTRKSLWAAGFALLVCILLLIGTTFAWFADSVSNGGNKIQAGNLSIEATAYDIGTGGLTVHNSNELINGGKGFSFEQTGQNLKTESTPIISETLWEPGKTSAKLLTGRNDGSLAAKVKVGFDTSDGGLQEALWFDFVQVDSNGNLTGQFEQRPMSGISELGDATELKLNANEAVSFVLVYGMYETAGNEYQDKSFSADVNILATQLNSEKDGFGNPDYDAGATYPVSDANDLTEAINVAQDGDTVALTGNITLDSPISINSDITIDGMGNGIISNQTIAANANVAFNDITLRKPTNTNSNATLVYGRNGCEILTFEGCTFSDPQWEVMQITSKDFKKLTVNNCIFTAEDVDGVANDVYGSEADQAIRYIHIQPKYDDNVTADVTITNNEFKNCNKVIAPIGIFYIDGNITIGRNTFENLEIDENSGKSGQLGVGWPNMEELKIVSNWEGEIRNFTIVK